MQEVGSHTATGEHLPKVSDQHNQGAASKAMEAQGLKPGETPATSTSQTVAQKLDAGDKQADKDRDALNRGHADVDQRQHEVKGNVDGQSTYVAGRVAGMAINEASGFVKEAISTAMEQSGFDINITEMNDKIKHQIGSDTGSQTIETIKGAGPHLGDKGGDHMGRFNIKEITDFDFDKDTPKSQEKTGDNPPKSKDDS